MNPSRSTSLCTFLLSSGALLWLFGTVAWAQPTPTLERADRILDFYGIAEEHRDTTSAEDFVEGESSLADRRKARARQLAILTAPGDGSVTTARRAEEESLFRRAIVHRSSPPPWRMWLPNLVTEVSTRHVEGRSELRALALAELRLSPGDLASTISPESVPPPPAPPPPPPGWTSAPKLSLAEASCLEEVRRSAVVLAMADPTRARSMIERARRAAWLPELRLRADWRFGRNESLDIPSTPDRAAGPLGLDTVNDVRYEARATWDLAKLVFSAEELAAEAQALRVVDMRRDIETSVNRLYFERRRLLASALVAGSERGARPERALRMQEIAVELDTASGGAYGRCNPASFIEEEP
jgi:hypothetical protein